jgi:hypothetical protein
MSNDINTPPTNFPADLEAEARKSNNNDEERSKEIAQVCVEHRAKKRRKKT